MTGHLIRRAHVAALLAAGVIAGVATASPALASPPDRFSIHVDETFVSNESEGCGFEILLRVEGTFTFMDRYDRAGNLVNSLVTYPSVSFTFSNPVTGESIRSSSPDPEHYTWNADGTFTLTVTGLVMHWVVPGEGVLGADSGRMTLTFDANGDLVSEDTIGHHLPRYPALCEILAA